MIEHKFPTESLIGGWYMQEKICDDLINYFEDNKDNAIKGAPGGETVNKDLVDDLRLPLDRFNPHNSFVNYVKSLQKCLTNYTQKFTDCQRMPEYELEQYTNLQKYEPGQGYKVWHFEDDGISKRLFVFTTYLNDVDDGGTHFKYQNLTAPAKKGLTVIWPAPWTHTHKGQISLTKTKYIVTGWFTINE